VVVVMVVVVVVVVVVVMGRPLNWPGRYVVGLDVCWDMAWREGLA
jgi:hypothetical protein